MIACPSDGLSVVVRSSRQHFLHNVIQVESVLMGIIMIVLKVFISFLSCWVFFSIMVAGYSTLLNSLKSN